ncbi:ABC transporter substrate-binding protein [Roseiarcaceae bacterium H3SJ34-1]|uniref:ABC transporter substrate-binding protein n=1 Tax=Terripilifer ovatus TaxID=3032367 RepID=UPI003AB96FCA|nr:ABC transporter substrate-binding protein [Roseiarcaceae bacterium H3SJ34-1]
MKHKTATVVALAALLAATHLAAAQDTLKLAVGQQGALPTSVSEIGVRAGIFKKHNLALELTYTAGGGETLQPVIAGAVDLGIGVGTSAVMGAFTKGAPVRIIGGNTTGAMDLMWFVKSDSPIKSMKDVNGRTFAYGSTGSSTQIVARALLKQFGVNAQMVATGNFAATMTATMSGQIDVGWTSPPLVFEPLNAGKIRILTSGADAKEYVDQTVRVIAANANSLATKADAIKRYVAAYRETMAWMYSSDPKALTAIAAFMGTNEKIARQTLDIYTKESLDFDRITGLDGVMADAVEAKFMSAPLTEQQLKAVIIKIPAP